MPETYRVDTFEVPDAARDEFWRNVRRTHAILRAQPGFVDDMLLEKRTDDGCTALTVVRWASEAALPGARAAVEAAHATADFRPGEFFARAGIEADLGTYVAV